MTRTLALVVYTAFVTWFALLIASVLRARAWTPEGMKLAFGNREHMPEPTALAGRAERAARNTLENFVLFAALALTAQAAGAPEARTALGAHCSLSSRSCIRARPSCAPCCAGRRLVSSPASTRTCGPMRRSSASKS